MRQFHFELVKMNLEQNSLYGPSWGPQEFLEPRERLRHLYTNQVMLYLLMGYDTGVFDETALRGVLADMFHGKVARDYWVVASPVWLEESKGLKSNFVSIVAEEYAKAVSRGAPVVLEEDLPVTTAPNSLKESGQAPTGSSRGALVAAFVAGGIVAASVRRVRRGAFNHSE